MLLSSLVAELRCERRVLPHRRMLADHGLTFEWCAGRSSPLFVPFPKLPYFP